MHEARFVKRALRTLTQSLPPPLLCGTEAKEQAVVHPALVHPCSAHGNRIKCFCPENTAQGILCSQKHPHRRSELDSEPIRLYEKSQSVDRIGSKASLERQWKSFLC